MPTFHNLSPAQRDELWAVLALRHAKGIGPHRGKELAESFGGVLPAVRAGLDDPSSWTKANLAAPQWSRTFAAGGWREGASREWAVLKASSLDFLHYGHPLYPDILREIPDPPLLLYYKGDTALLRGPAVGVVGARNCSREGVNVAAIFSRGLSLAGVAVISGMAKGIDRAAHLGGLEGPGGSIAVLGTGIDMVYPFCNRDLYQLLAEKGLLLSEFTPGTQPKPKHFPMRNRLISGLSRGLFVAEAAARSGSLITARLALEQGRDVFAAPGHTLDGRAAGCHDLILNGAKAVFSPDHILRELTPLLSHEAVTALERRRLEDIEARKKAPSRKPGLDWHVDDQNRAEALLPKVDLPWLAPEGTARMAAGKNAKSVRSAPPSPSATAAPAGPVAQSRKKAGGRPGPAVPKAVPLDPEQARVFAALGREKRHIADLAAALECAEPALSGLLAMLEVKGLARHHPGMFYSLP